MKGTVLCLLPGADKEPSPSPVPGFTFPGTVSYYGEATALRQQICCRQQSEKQTSKMYKSFCNKSLVSLSFRAGLSEG